MKKKQRLKDYQKNYCEAKKIAIRKYLLMIIIF